MSNTISRREILVGGAAAAAVIAAGLGFRGAELSRLFSLLLTDTRFVESQGFAAQLMASTRRHLDVADDFCSRWYGSLRDIVVAEKGPITGLTTWMDFEVVRGCAREEGLVCKAQRTIVSAGQPTLVAWVAQPRLTS